MNQTLPREADFAGAQPRFWNGDDAARTIVLDAFSLMFPSAENFMLRGMQGVHDRLDDPALKRAVAGFVRQEASHARLHRAYNAAMQSRGFDTAAQEARNAAFIAAMDARVGTRRRIAASAGLEHFTTLIAQRLIDDPSILAGADERYRRLWVWHSSEEIEHRSVAFDVHAALFPHGAWLSRVRAMGSALLILNVLFWSNVAHLAHGARDRGSVRVWGGILWFLLGGPGFFRRALAPTLAYFGPGFHPRFHPRGRAHEGEAAPMLACATPPSTAMVSPIT